MGVDSMLLTRWVKELQWEWTLASSHDSGQIVFLGRPYLSVTRGLQSGAPT